jgi:hypothetical protein
MNITQLQKSNFVPRAQFVDENGEPIEDLSRPEVRRVAPGNAREEAKLRQTIKDEAELAKLINPELKQFNLSKVQAIMHSKDAERAARGKEIYSLLFELDEEIQELTLEENKVIAAKLKTENKELAKEARKAKEKREKIVIQLATATSYFNDAQTAYKKAVEKLDRIKRTNAPNWLSTDQEWETHYAGIAAQELAISQTIDNENDCRTTCNGLITQVSELTLLYDKYFAEYHAQKRRINLLLGVKEDAKKSSVNSGTAANFGLS